MRLFVLAILICLTFVVGCSDGRNLSKTRVAGTVTYNGEPLTSGSVVVHAQNRRN